MILNSSQTLGPIDDRAVVITLLSMLKADHEFRMQRYQAVAHALGKLGKDAAPALVEALRDDHLEIRLCAASALRKIGRSTNETIPALKEALNDIDPRVRMEAALTLLQPRA